MRMTLVFILLISTALLGCKIESKGKSKTKEIPTAPPSIKKEISCAYSLEDGESTFVVPETELRMFSNFEKPYDENRLNPLMKLSLKASHAFIIESGRKLAQPSPVDVYVASTDADVCRPLSPLLQAPPKELFEYWNKINASIKEETEGKSTVLGVYLGVRHPSQPTNKSNASIIVTDYVSKWTLVHEFMHHLFRAELDKSVAAGTTLSDEQLYDVFRESYKKSKALREKADEDVATSEEYNTAHTTFIQEHNQATRYMIELLKRYALEEMTIETQLGIKYENNEFQKVHRLEHITGAAYIKSKYADAKEDIAPTLKTLDSSIAFFSTHEDPNNAALKTEAESLRNELLYLDEQIESLNSKAENIIANFKKEQARTLGIGIAPEDLEFIPTPCSHRLPEDIDVSDLSF